MRGVKGWIRFEEIDESKRMPFEESGQFLWSCSSWKTIAFNSKVREGGGIAASLLKAACYAALARCSLASLAVRSGIARTAVKS